MNGLQGRVAVVTGASGGIGGAVCRRFRGEGASVWSLDIRPPKVGTDQYIETDVTSPESVEAAARQILERAGRVDILVAGAGFTHDTPAENITPEIYDSVLELNLRGVLLSSQSFGRIMLEQGAGRIVAISSAAGNHCVVDARQQLVYNISKSAVTALVKSLAVEWGPRGVRVNAISPGYIDTTALGPDAPVMQMLLDRTVLGRLGTPDEAASAINFLVSDEATYFQGAELLMDGGYTLR